jgi:2,4-dienoyl-CoA reductase-like NADH-dependent reductase (Old Yellow Enzyme family)
LNVGKDQDNSAAALLEPGRIGRLLLGNRIVRAATSESMAEIDGRVSRELVAFYRELGRGGAGLIITGHIYVEPRGQYTPRQMGIDRDECVPGLRSLTDAAHEGGGAIFAELAHAGSQSLIGDIEPVAPSLVPNAIFARTPREMDEDDINAVIDAFAAAARRAVEAGFDGIHIHGGNGYLISEFSSPHANRRDDRWGGCAENRGRFFLAICEAIRDAVGPDVPVTARIGVADALEDGLETGESTERARLLAAKGIDGFETTYGVMTSYRENIRPYVAVSALRAVTSGLVPRLWSPAGPEAYYREFARAIRQAVDVPVILVGGMRTTAMMNDVIRSGDADFIAMARPFIREPDIARQITNGRRGMVDCVSCNICLMHDGTDPLRCWRRRPADLAFHAYCRLWRDRGHPAL